ncbi:MAG: helix-turn-helix transcriptional regulator [Thiobacillaceae bacterium]|uniref:helix-turn-helix transcriptional regulator n=1 Tax=Undibacterium sp. RuRC25W TaxID=3413047 RepID=UPI003BF005D5
MEKLVLSENELAQHWGVSPKTLQRWRSEGRGPYYMKLSKRVVYPLAEIRAYEHSALHASTSERANGHSPASRSNLVTAKEAAIATSLPAYMFSNKRIREAVGMPCVQINSSLRFNLEEVMKWASRRSAESDE